MTPVQHRRARYTPAMARIRRAEDLPFGVVVVAFGFLLNALLFAGVLAHIRDGARVAERVLSDAGWLWPTYIALIAIEVLVAVLLLRRNPFGWVLAMIIICISLAVYLVAWFVGDPEYIRMAVYSIMALYLNQRSVRTTFGWHPVDDSPRTIVSREDDEARR
jgi:hypothetical protein